MGTKYRQSEEIRSSLREEIARLRQLSARSLQLQKWAKERTEFYRMQMEEFREGTLKLER